MVNNTYEPSIKYSGKQITDSQIPNKKLEITSSIITVVCIHYLYNY